MHIFYTPDIAGNAYVLNEEESKHCIRVLRMQENDQVWLVDGRGGFYTAKISDPNPKKTVLKIIRSEQNYGRRNHYLHIAVAPTKQIERLEWFVEKATEIGIDEITPIICDRSERKEVKTERIGKIITSAVKQSIQAYHPRLNEPVKLKQFIGLNSGPAQKYVAHCINADKAALKEEYIAGQPCTILIGPEGDFTSEEITMAAQAGYRAITLGNTRLRTETAALKACFEINFLNR